MYSNLVLSILQTISDAKTFRIALNSFAQFTRQNLAVDQLVVYIKQANGLLEPVFARSKDNQVTDGADLTWGYTVASQTMEKNESLQQNSNTTTEKKSASLPLRFGGNLVGALVVMRMNGVEFSESELSTLETISPVLALLLCNHMQQEQIEALNLRLKRSNIQEDVISLVSHELLSPLGLIKGYTSMLIHKGSEWEPQKQSEYLTIIDQESDRLRGMIDALLDSSRLQSGSIQMNTHPISLNQLVEDIAQRARTYDNSLKLTLSIEAENITVVADTIRLIQVFDNLFSNAQKYAPGASVNIHLSKSGEWVQILFSDSGPGIEAKYLDGIFQKFYRVPNDLKRTKGVGLGLFICHEIIRAHHGEMKVVSKPGEGTTFQILLPTHIDERNG